MSFSLTSNATSASANYHLGKNQAELRKSLTRLASGKRIIAPYDDPGTLSVSMKLGATINRLKGADNNLQNAISFLEVQDGILDAVGKVVTRMNELKGLSSQDPMKSDQDVESYNNEFRDLQMQLYQMSQQTFNGVSLFANSTNEGTDVKFRGTTSEDNTISIFTSPDGSDGPAISIHKSSLLSALTIDSDAVSINNGQYFKDAGTDNKVAFAAETLSKTFALDTVSAGVFEKALENIAYLRAQAGGSMSRVTFASESIGIQKTNMKAALSRMVDVDVAEESARMAKYSVLTQASAAMVAQANSLSEVSLILLR